MTSGSALDVPAAGGAVRLEGEGPVGRDGGTLMDAGAVGLCVELFHGPALG